MAAATTLGTHVSMRDVTCSRTNAWRVLRLAIAWGDDWSRPSFARCRYAERSVTDAFGALA